MILALIEKKLVSALMMQKKVNIQVVATKTYRMNTRRMEKISILMNMIGISMIVQNQQYM